MIQQMDLSLVRQKSMGLLSVNALQLQANNTLQFQANNALQSQATQQFKSMMQGVLQNTEIPCSTSNIALPKDETEKAMTDMAELYAPAYTGTAAALAFLGQASNVNTEVVSTKADTAVQNGAIYLDKANTVLAELPVLEHAVPQQGSTVPKHVMGNIAENNVANTVNVGDSALLQKDTAPQTIQPFFANQMPSGLQTDAFRRSGIAETKAPTLAAGEEAVSGSITFSEHDLAEIGLTNAPKVPIKQLNADTGFSVQETLSANASNKDSPLLKVSIPSKGADEESPQKNSTDFPVTTSEQRNDLSLNHVAKMPAETPSTTSKPSEVGQTLAPQLAEQLEKGLAAGKKEFQIELHPVELGKVSVKMVSEGGILTVELKALNGDTQTMLLNHAEEIKAVLQAAVNHHGTVIETNTAEYFGDQQQDGNNNEAEQHKQQQKEARQFTHEPEEKEQEMTAGDFLTLMQTIEQSYEYNR